MASNALEEKIEKIRLQNEKIRQRYEEVEADKKNAAKLNALVQLVPSDDWPDRKEPPEFSAPPKNSQVQKNFSRYHDDRVQRSSGAQERSTRREHKYNQGEGPPPDPKYNFLADSERESRSMTVEGIDGDEDFSKNKNPRNVNRRRGGGRDGGSGGNRPGRHSGDFVGNKDAYFKDNRGPNAFCSRDGSLPEYEAWRAERNRIDEARINRQKTAEGNWRREWDCEKVNVQKELPRRDVSKRDFGSHEKEAPKRDFNRRDSGKFEKRHNYSDDDHPNRIPGSGRTYRGSQKNHGFQDSRRPNDQFYDRKQNDVKMPGPSIDGRSVIATDRSIKVTVSPNSQSKGSVMSVKVNSTNVAGTGRVGPRQKNRISYSSQSDAEANPQNINSPTSHEPLEETVVRDRSIPQKSLTKSPFSQRKKRGDSKSSVAQQKEGGASESAINTGSVSSPHPQPKEQRKPRAHKKIQKVIEDNTRSSSISDNAIPSEYYSNLPPDPNDGPDSIHSDKIVENASQVSLEEDGGTQQIIHDLDNLRTNDHLIHEQTNDTSDEICASNSVDKNTDLHQDRKSEDRVHDALDGVGERYASGVVITDSKYTNNESNEPRVHEGNVDVEGGTVSSGIESSHDGESTSVELQPANSSDRQTNSQIDEEINAFSHVQKGDSSSVNNAIQVPAGSEQESNVTDDVQMELETVDRSSPGEKNDLNVNDDGNIGKGIQYETVDVLLENNAEGQADSSKELKDVHVAVSGEQNPEHAWTGKEANQLDHGPNGSAEVLVNEFTINDDSCSNSESKDNTTSNQSDLMPNLHSSHRAEPGSAMPSEMAGNLSQTASKSRENAEQTINDSESCADTFANDSGFVDTDTLKESDDSEDIQKNNIKEVLNNASPNDGNSSDLASNLTESNTKTTDEQILKDAPMNSTCDIKEVTEKSANVGDAVEISSLQDSRMREGSDCQNLDIIADDNVTDVVPGGLEKSSGQCLAPKTSSIELNSDPDLALESTAKDPKESITDKID